MSATAPIDPTMRPAINPWIIAMTVTLATFMEVLDTSIANVALPHIAGSLSVSVHESTWVLTSYLVANAVVLPLTGWLSSILGRKRFYMSCVVLFTISSALCGMATSIEQLVLFRVLQGLAGGGLQPSEQAILMDTFPPARRGMAMAIYTLAILVAPVLGPTLGGYITENYSWRLIFYINIPVGVLSVFLSSLVLEDPPYLKAQRAAHRGRPMRIDFLGLSLLSIGLAALELMLDKGQEHDWFDSPFIVHLAVVAAVMLIAVVFWELRHPAPIINLRLFCDRNFAAASVCVFCAFGVLYGSNVLLPQMLQTLMGYSALNAGLVLSPAGFVTMLEMPVIGILLSRGADARKMIVAGLLTVGLASLWMAGLNLGVSPGMVISPRNFQTLGAGLMFVPLNMIAYAFIPKDQTNNASGLFSLVRNEGSSIGVALTNTLLQRRTQFHQFRLTEHINPLNPTASQWLTGVSGAFLARRGDPGLAHRQGLRMMYQFVQQQAAAVSYLDMFWLFAMLAFAVIPLAFLMKRSTSDADSLAVH
ncbi:MAG: DHA2 family efflux MFS transporter permease subunit [Planctomycetaceae bacterium]|nr:DHA2 family efflux MFS transporter permease subunit [Planctomycetaceae bacterium]